MFEFKVTVHCSLWSKCTELPGQSCDTDHRVEHEPNMKLFDRYKFQRTFFVSRGTCADVSNTTNPKDIPVA